MITVMRFSYLLLAICLVGCSSSSSNKPAKAEAAAPPRSMATNSSNPAAKYVELVGYRIGEKGPGHLQLQFGVVNHSEADLGDLKLNVQMKTTTGKLTDPPLFTFTVKVPSLGPAEMKPMTVEIPLKLRAYELPDWQFLRAEFQIDDTK